MKTIVNILIFDIFSKLFVSIISIYLIRMLTVEEYAKYTIVLTYATLLFQVVYGVIQRKFIFEVTKADENEKLIEWIYMYIIVNIIYSIFLSFYVQDNIIIIQIFLFSFFLFVYSSLRLSFQKSINFKHYNIAEFFKGFIFFLLSLILIYFNIEKSYFYVYTQVLALFIVSVYLIKKIDFKFIIERSRIKKYFKCTNYKNSDYILFVYILTNSIITQLGIILAHYLYDDYFLASYGANYRYYFLIGLIANAILTFVLPTINKINNFDIMFLFYKKIFIYSLVLFPIFLITYLYSNELLFIIDKGRYEKGYNIFKILLVSSYISLIFTPFVGVILKIKKYKYLLFNSLVGLILFLFISFYFNSLIENTSVAYAHLISYSWISISYIFGVFYYNKELRKDNNV